MQIPWDGAVRAGDLAEAQLKTIKSVDKVRKEQRKQTIESDPGKYASLLTGGEEVPSVLEKANKRPDIVQYVLILINELITGKHSTLSYTCIVQLTAVSRYPNTRRHDSPAAGSIQADSPSAQQIEQPRRGPTTSSRYSPHQSHRVFHHI